MRSTRAPDAGGGSRSGSALRVAEVHLRGRQTAPCQRKEHPWLSRVGRSSTSATASRSSTAPRRRVLVSSTSRPRRSTSSATTSRWRPSGTPRTCRSSVALPFLYLESMSYRFGLRQRHPDRHPARRHDLLQPRPHLRRDRRRHRLLGPDDRHRPPGLPVRRGRRPPRARGHRRHQAAHLRHGLHRDLRRGLRRRGGHHGAPDKDTGTGHRHDPDHLLLARTRSPTPERCTPTPRSSRPRSRAATSRSTSAATTPPTSPARRPTSWPSSRSGRLAGHPGQGRGVRQLLRGRPGLRRPDRQRLGRLQARDPPTAGLLRQITGVTDATKVIGTSTRCRCRWTS
jgi:hypothetical protein